MLTNLANYIMRTRVSCVRELAPVPRAPPGKVPGVKPGRSFGGVVRVRVVYPLPEELGGGT